MTVWKSRFIWLALLAATWPAAGQVFRLPTANRALFDKGGEERFFAPTPGKPWTSGSFGCVRSEGWQMHEGLDIRSVQHDKHGEPTDPVMATANGTVAYVNRKPGLSNYGRYVMVRHEVEGLEIYSLYAHLASVLSGLEAGAAVRAGETIGIMGRSSNTASGIGKDRAHVHFELDLLVNDRFAQWFQKAFPGERNDHGLWNGRNFLALDAGAILLDQQAQGARFSVRGFIAARAELCRVMVHDARFPWLQRYAALVEAAPASAGQPAAGYELVLDYNGIPVRLIPHPASDFRGPAKYRLLSVNRAEYERHHCRKLVAPHDGAWQLTPHGQSLLDQITY